MCLNQILNKCNYKNLCIHRKNEFFRFDNQSKNLFGIIKIKKKVLLIKIQSLYWRY